MNHQYNQYKKRDHKIYSVRTDKGVGDRHDDSYLAWKMEKEDSSEAFEQQAKNFTKSLLPTSLHFKANDFRRALFCLLIKPRAATSTEKWKTL